MNKNIKELLKDKSFLNWVKSNAEDVSKWDSWSKGDPKRQELLEDAKIMVDGFSFKKKPIEDQKTNKSWNSLSSKIKTSSSLPKKTNVFSYQKQFLKIAAIFLLGIFSFWGIKNWTTIPTPQLIVFQTAPDEINSFELPDGSNITLNTNSKISFQDDFLNQKNREILLDGEAFFKIKKQDAGKVFQVKINDLTVNVIGTSFNINSKRESPIISLVEGKVSLIKSNFGEKELEAGQTAQFSTIQNKFEITTQQTAYWKSWTLNKWSFGTGTPMQEVLERIEETFGLTCRVKDSEILKKEASGDVSAENKEVLFEALSVLLDLEFKVRDKQLIISPLE